MEEERVILRVLITCGIHNVGLIRNILRWGQDTKPSLFLPKP